MSSASTRASLLVLLRRAWPHVVAAFVVLHVVASAVDALPNPGPGMDRRAWREPRVRHELRAWAARLHLEPAAFEEHLWDLATTWVSTRKAIVAPFRPYLSASGVRQSWSMFVAGTRVRDRFQIRARACAVDDPTCDWQAVYTRGVDAEDWLRPVLESPRLRSGTFRWVWPDHGRRYRLSCRNLARLLVRERPDVQAVQCRFERSIAPGPHDDGDKPRPPPSFGREVVVTRADLEGAAP